MPHLRQKSKSRVLFKICMVILQRSVSQHIDQEKLCLRAGKCSNSNLEEQTQGNDNSITGFADQSKNVQAAVKPTPTPTPTLTLQNFGVLGISKVCFPSCPGVKFSITVTGNNPQPSSFTLGDGNTQDVILGPGGFTVTESFSRPRDAPLFHGGCDQSDRSPIGTATGIIRAGESKSCVITNVR
jgi:hypothetical protein